MNDLDGTVTAEYNQIGDVAKATDHLENSTFYDYDLRGKMVSDGTGQIYMRSRYYSTDMKRFISKDVVRGDLTES